MGTLICQNQYQQTVTRPMTARNLEKIKMSCNTLKKYFKIPKTKTLIQQTNTKENIDSKTKKKSIQKNQIQIYRFK